VLAAKEGKKVCQSLTGWSGEEDRVRVRGMGSVGNWSVLSSGWDAVTA
jgi:hypothetical protein